MAHLHIKLLGGFEIQSASGEALVIKGRKSQALLAYLASPPGESRSRDKLTALLWSDPASARRAYQNDAQCLKLVKTGG